MRRSLNTLAQRGTCLAEILVASALTILLSAALLVGAVTLQKSFMASRHHVKCQAEQMRLLDMIALDLRRALTVSMSGGALNTTLPDYYDAFGNAREAQVTQGQIQYGTGSVRVSYYKRGDAVYRNINGVETALATGVQDFALDYQDQGQTIGVSITFVPRYRMDVAAQEAMRGGTAATTTTLLRNKRRTAS